MTQARRHTHAVDLPAPPELVFAALHTPSAIRQWWGTDRAVILPRTGGVWSAAWGDQEDDPDYVTTARITEFTPPCRMCLGQWEYYARDDSLPFEADLTTEFVVTPIESGSRLTVVQDGSPADSAADEFFTACAKGWEETFADFERFFTE